MLQLQDSPLDGLGKLLFCSLKCLRYSLFLFCMAVLLACAAAILYNPTAEYYIGVSFVGLTCLFILFALWMPFYQFVFNISLDQNGSHVARVQFDANRRASVQIIVHEPVMVPRKENQVDAAIGGIPI